MTNKEKPSLTPELKSELLSLYKDNLNFSNSEARLEVILMHVDIHLSAEDINGWSVLDLGCGSPDSASADYGDKDDFEAWFLRMCTLNGAKKAIGIDLYDQDPKDACLYTHINANLINLLSGNNLVSLFELDGAQFDLINTNGVLGFVAPGYTYAITAGLSVTEHLFGIPSWFKTKTYSLIENLKQQSVNLLSPQGLLAINQEVYIRAGDKLKKLESPFDY